MNHWVIEFEVHKAEKVELNWEVSRGDVKQNDKERVKFYDSFDLWIHFQNPDKKMSIKKSHSHRVTSL